MTIVAGDVVGRPGKVEQLVLEVVSVGAEVGQQVVAQLLAADRVHLDPVNDLRDEVRLLAVQAIDGQQSV